MILAVSLHFFALEYYSESLIHMVLIHLHSINPNGAVSFDEFICYRMLNIRKLWVLAM